MAYYLELSDKYLDLYKTLRADFGTEAEVQMVIDNLNADLKNLRSSDPETRKTRQALNGAEELLGTMKKISDDIRVMQIIANDDICGTGMLAHANRNKAYLWICEKILVLAQPEMVPSQTRAA